MGAKHSPTNGDKRFHTLMLLLTGAVLIAVAACSLAAPSPSPSPPSPMPPIPSPTTARVSARLIPHPIAGREKCLLCHGEGEAAAVPADHAGRSDETCIACHDMQPSPSRLPGGGAAEMGRVIWQERAGLSCRNCHGYGGEGGFGPPLEGTKLDFESFRRLVRSPRSRRMPPIAISPDDPAMERSGTWVGDDVLRLIYAWLTGMEPGPKPEIAAPPITHGLEGREDCLFCHGADKAMPVPADHRGWGNESCLKCHSTK